MKILLRISVSLPFYIKWRLPLLSPFLFLLLFLVILYFVVINEIEIRVIQYFHTQIMSEILVPLVLQSCHQLGAEVVELGGAGQWTFFPVTLSESEFYSFIECSPFPRYQKAIFLWSTTILLHWCCCCCCCNH